jgi:transcriptional regulator with XRE-family HTH domain
VNTQVKRRKDAAMKSAATNDRNFRTFLLVAQLEAKAIGLRIKRARDEAGLTQEQLADLAVGFSKRSLQDYEAGTTIPYKHMQEIAALTGKAPEWLIHGDPEPTRESEDALDRVHDRLTAIEARVLELSGLLRASLELEEETGSDPAPGQSERGSATLA